MKNLNEIFLKWYAMLENKEAYAFGDEEIDLDDYKLLVKETYYTIRDMHVIIESGDYSSITPEDMRTYLDMLTCIASYSAICFTDNSADNTFALTRFLAVSLQDLGANYSFYLNNEDYDFEEGIMSTEEGFNYGRDRVLYYDVNEGDIADYLELAKARGC